MKRVTTSIPEADFVALEEISERAGGSISLWIRMAVSHWLDGQWLRDTALSQLQCDAVVEKRAQKVAP